MSDENLSIAEVIEQKGTLVEGSKAVLTIIPTADLPPVLTTPFAMGKTDRGEFEIVSVVGSADLIVKTSERAIFVNIKDVLDDAAARVFS